MLRLYGAMLNVNPYPAWNNMALAVWATSEREARDKIEAAIDMAPHAHLWRAWGCQIKPLE